MYYLLLAYMAWKYYPVIEQTYTVLSYANTVRHYLTDKPTLTADEEKEWVLVEE